MDFWEKTPQIQHLKPTKYQFQTNVGFAEKS
jgi:hypothetical protein